MFTWLESTKVARSRAVQPDFALRDWIIAILTKYLFPPSTKYLYNAKYLYLTVGSAPASSKVVTTSE